MVSATSSISSAGSPSASISLNAQNAFDAFDPFAPLGAREQFMCEVKRIVPLQPIEEAALLHRIARGNQERLKAHQFTGVLADAEKACARLVEGYQPLVIALAKRYAAYCDGLELLDVIQEGNVGLMQALRQHRSEHDATAFGAWVFPWIAGMLRRACWQWAGGIRVPIEKARALRRLHDHQARLALELGREPTDSELAESLAYSVSEVRELQVLNHLQVVRLTSLPREEDGVAFDSVAASQEDDAASTANISPLMLLALGKLPGRERAVILLRYGFADGYARTTREAAEELGVTTHTVERLHRRALGRLKDVLVSQCSISTNSVDVPA